MIGVDGSSNADENAWSRKEAPLMLALVVGGVILLVAAYRLICGAGHRDMRHRR
ncbi:MAG: hypothetical protein PHS14_03730 [Elusimicrobia bacterium]|nr:hypothetical protein [Elusimicrobiota bacterium]